MSPKEEEKQKEPALSDNNSPIPVEEDDEPDEWDQRINKTGCADENLKLTDCYWDKKDWRQCQDEMKAFQSCWKKHGNAERTDMKDA